MVVQKNKFSLNFSAIEYYINETWGKQEDLEIFLRPILPKDISDSIENKGTYRRFNIKFDNVRYAHFTGEKGSTMKAIFNVFEKYKCINAEIVLTMGYNKTDYLDNATVTEAIRDVKNNEKIISKAEISYKDEIDDKIEVLDLFADKWHDFIYITIEKRESVLSGYVFSKMVEKYDEGRGALEETINK